jgi:hypothetical protein
LTAGALLTLAGLHVAWGLGSALPFRDRADLADAVIGGREVPGSAACFAVAGALGAGAALVSGVGVAGALRRTGLLGLAAVLGLRGALGVLGRTDVVSPGSTSARFRRLDRRVYAPLCLGLAGGALTARTGSVAT